MVAVKNAEADRFVKKPPPNIFLFLVCGPDAGLVSERARAIVSKAVDDPKDPFQFLRLSGDDIASDPLRLADEANTVPLFGNRRAIFIENQGKNLAPAIEPLLQHPPGDCTIVITAGKLNRDSPLRRLCEKDPRTAVLDCYADSARDVAQVIDAELAAAHLRIGPDAKELLISLLGLDRLTTRAEISKLILYAHGQGEVTAEHIEAIVTDASALALDTAIEGAFDGNFAAVEQTAARVFSDGGDYNRLLGAALRHATLLHRMRIGAESGRPLPPQGFGSRKAALDRHVRAWPSQKLADAIQTLSSAIGKARREPKLADVIAVRALWTVARAAPKR